MIKQLPNLISLSRLLLVPWFAVLLLERQFGLALLLYALMGLSDAMDGYLARQMKVASQLGAGLDPLADKVMLITAFVILGHMDLIPFWVVMLAVGRDALVIGGALLFYLFNQGQIIQTQLIGKINTFVQIILVLVVLTGQWFAMPIPWVDPLLAVMVVTTVISGLSYGVAWVRSLALLQRST